MATRTKEELENAERSWNYADVIGLVTANLRGDKFKGDRGAWLRGIYELRRLYPTYFKGVHFRPREPFTPFSPQVDEVLKILGRWEYRSDFNPKFRRLEISGEGKAELKALLEPKLSAHRDKITEMARILENYVLPDEGDQPHGGDVTEAPN